MHGEKVVECRNEGAWIRGVHGPGWTPCDNSGGTGDPRESQEPPVFREIGTSHVRRVPANYSDRIEAPLQII